MNPEEYGIVVVYVLGSDADGKRKLFRISLDVRVRDEIERMNGEIVVDLSSGEQYPRVEYPPHKSTRLHRYVWRFFYPRVATKKGFVIHHWNEDKLDNTIQNLELVSRRVHAKHHLEARRRRKFSPKKRDGNTLYRHRPPRTLPVSASKQEIEKTRPAVEPKKTQGTLLLALVREAEEVLRAHLTALRQEMAWLFVNGQLPIKTELDPRWDTGRSWMMQLKKPRLELKQSEEALVLLLVGHGFDANRVAVEMDLSVEVLKKIASRTAVAHATASLAKMAKKLREGASTHPPT